MLRNKNTSQQKKKKLVELMRTVEERAGELQC